MVNAGADMHVEHGIPANIRIEERVQGVIAGRIVLASLAEARSVTLRDISRGGAKLAVGDWPDLPRSFYLLLRASGMEEPVRIECERRWQVGPTIGVRFTVPLEEGVLGGLFPPESNVAA